MLIRVLFLCLAGSTATAQTTSSVRVLERTADSLYRAANYAAAAPCYLRLADKADFNLKKATAYYDAACCLALQNQPDSAFRYLREAVAKGYRNKAHLLKDADLVSLHPAAQWQQLVNRLPTLPELNTDPAKARFATDDIRHFWQAWDAAYADTTRFREAFRTLYFDKASRGMDDYMTMKVNSIDAFVAHVRSAPRFYRSIRTATLATDRFEPQFVAVFKKLKQVYPAAAFPDVYFVMGAFTSAGTVSGAGLLLGVNQGSQTDTTIADEIQPRLRTLLSRHENLPYVVAHELIHFQQNGIKEDTITLGYAINEGMADFLGELISGQVPDQPLFDWAKGREQAIWNRFTADMYFNRYDNWIANSQRSSPDRPADQGYWVGYQICRAYYEQAKDKKKAIDEMLHIRDYRKFLAQSGWEQKLAKMKPE